MQQTTLLGRQSIGNEWIHGSGSNLGFVPAVVYPILDVVIISAPFIVNAIMANSPVEIPGESAFAKELWRYRRDLMSRWGFEAVKAPKADAVEILTKCSSIAATALQGSATAKTWLSPSWDEQLVPWERKVGRRTAEFQSRLAKASSSQADWVDVSGLRALIGDFFLDMRGLVAAIEYALANDAFQGPLGSIAAIFVSLVDLINSLGKVVVQVLNTLVEFSKTLADIIRKLPKATPTIVYLAVFGGLGFITYFGFRRFAPRRRR